MLRKVRQFFTIPEEICGEYWKNCLRKNRIALLIICFGAIPIELFNICRVLFFSRSGIRSVNNQVYLCFYSALIIFSLLYLVVSRLARNTKVRTQCWIQYVAMGGYLLWNIAVNTYDYLRNPTAEAYVFVAAVLGITIFFHMPNLYMLLCVAVGHCLFLFLNRNALEVGDVVNLSITTIIALGIAVVQSHHNVVEISQRQKINQINKQLEDLLEQDQMLGILNKSAMELRIKNALKRVNSENPIGVFLIDVDDFKRINDRFGHPCGDDVLIQVAHILQGVFEGVSQSIGRVGGDEFSALVPYSESAEQLVDFAQKIIQRTEQIKWNGVEVGACCSMGIIRVSREGVTFDQLYKEVDRLLYMAKEDKKGSFLFKEWEA